MRIKLSSYALVGIEAVPVDVVAGENRVSVVDPETGRVLHSVRLDRNESGSSLVEHVVNVRTSPLRKRAPERLLATNSSQSSHVAQGPALQASEV